MKKTGVIFLMLLTALTTIACESGSSEQLNPEKTMEVKKTIKLTVGNKTFIANLTENSSAQALYELIANGNIMIPMSDYGNMEKVGPLGTTLPKNDERITTVPGDLILYQGNSFVIYYASNTYSLTRLGKIQDVTREELISALGNGEVTVTLSLN